MRDSLRDLVRAETDHSDLNLDIGFVQALASPSRRISGK